MWDLVIGIFFVIVLFVFFVSVVLICYVNYCEDVLVKEFYVDVVGMVYVKVDVSLLFLNCMFFVGYFIFLCLVIILELYLFILLVYF